MPPWITFSKEMILQGAQTHEMLPQPLANWERHVLLRPHVVMRRRFPWAFQVQPRQQGTHAATLGVETWVGHPLPSYEAFVFTLATFEAFRRQAVAANPHCDLAQNLPGGLVLHNVDIVAGPCCC